MAAMDSAARVSSVLLKAKLVASKLGMGDTEMARWIECELDSYVGKNRVLPTYRVLMGQPYAINPTLGEIPVHLASDNGKLQQSLQEALFEVHFTNGVPEIEALIEKGNTSRLRVPFPLELQHIVWDLAGNNWPLRWALGSGQLHGLVEAVRNRIMQWALDLETGGVLGGDFQFTLIERNAAMSITNNFTNSNIGNVGDVLHGGQVSVNQSVSNLIEIDKVAAFLDQVSGAMTALPTEVRSAVAEPITALNSEIKTSIPNQNKIKVALMSIRTICEGATGNLVASGVVTAIASLLGQH